MLRINREFEQCFYLIQNYLIAQNEVNMQGEISK